MSDPFSADDVADDLFASVVVGKSKIVYAAVLDATEWLHSDCSSQIYQRHYCAHGLVAPIEVHVRQNGWGKSTP